MGIISSILFPRWLKRRCYGNRLLARIGENWTYMHVARVNTAGESSTSDKNLVNIGPVTPESCRRRAGYTLGAFLVS